MQDSRDYLSPTYEDPTPFDYEVRDNTIAELVIILQEVKQSNGIFTDEFNDAMDKLLTAKIEK
jgi:hypothetical protein